MFKRFICLLVYFLSPIIPILVIYYSDDQKYSDINNFIPMLLGATAYTWLTAEFILSSRPKFIEKYFGLDKFYRFHGLMALISVSLVFIHRMIEEDLMGDMFTSEFGNISWIIFIVLIILSLVLMVDSILLKVKPIYIFKKYMKKFRFAKYEYQVAMHNLTILALVLMFIHVILTSSATASSAVMTVYIVYFALGFGFYLYHKVIKRILLKNKMFNIEELIDEGANMWTLKLKPENGNIFSYKAGQFGFLRIFGQDVSKEEHPFSISSEPSNNEFIMITIKELGDYTSNIKNVKVGDKAQFDGPYGNFCYTDYSKEDGVVMIVGGVGITPALSMLRYMKNQDKDKKVILLWGVNTRNDLICTHEFKEIQSVMKNFTCIQVIANDDTWEGERGFINKDKIINATKNNGFNIDSTGFYICGPGIMTENVLKALKEIGVKKNKIHFEKFSM